MHYLKKKQKNNGKRKLIVQNFNIYAKV